MCGIIACRVPGAADAYLVQALAALEYRGYDSVGIALQTTANTTLRVRSTSRVSELAARLTTLPQPELTGVGIGHTRWATHGGVTEANGHPHIDCSGLVSVVHNGIIENSTQLRTLLEAAGHAFASEVDSEVIPHLVEDELRAGRTLTAAVAAVAERLEGSWAIVVMDARTGQVVGTAHRAPLIVATSPRGSFFASDVSAIAAWIDSYRVLRDGDVVDLGLQPIWHDELRGVPESIVLDWTVGSRQLFGYADFMEKEINEQPEIAAGVLARTADLAVRGALWRGSGLPAFERVAIIGCGTSLNAGGIIAAAFRKFGGIPTSCIVASEAAEFVCEPSTLVIAISQSGETADILRAVDGANLRGQSLLAITNNPHSTLARRADAVVECSAGHEVGVAATKTFVAQVLTGVSVAISALVVSDRISRSRASAVVDDLRRMPDLLAQSLAVSKDVVPALAADLLHAPGFLFLGRGSGVTYAAEGALKLKELTYRWAEHYPAGELKHGPLALVEQGTPVIVVDGGDPRIAGNVAEVSARGARVISIGGSGSTIPALGLSLSAPVTGGFDPCGPLESVIPLQLLARELAVGLGRDVDKPRNLAKSVTVE